MRNSSIKWNSNHLCIQKRCDELAIVYLFCAVQKWFGTTWDFNECCLRNDDKVYFVSFRVSFTRLLACTHTHTYVSIQPSRICTSDQSFCQPETDTHSISNAIEHSGFTTFFGNLKKKRVDKWEKNTLKKNGRDEDEKKQQQERWRRHKTTPFTPKHTPKRVATDKGHDDSCCVCVFVYQMLNAHDVFVIMIVCFCAVLWFLRFNAFPCSFETFISGIYAFHFVVCVRVCLFFPPSHLFFTLRLLDKNLVFTYKLSDEHIQMYYVLCECVSVYDWIS